MDLIENLKLFLTLGEEDRLTVCENRMLRRIYEPKTGKVAEGWRKLNNKELRKVYRMFLA
jgi:hypothetical protein